MSRPTSALRMPVPPGEPATQSGCIRHRRGTSENAIAFTGTKVQPRPAHLANPETNTSCIPIISNKAGHLAYGDRYQQKASVELMPRGAVITPVYQHRVAHEGPTAATVFATRSDGARSHRENRVDLEEIPIADCVHPA